MLKTHLAQHIKLSIPSSKHNEPSAIKPYFSRSLTDQLHEFTLANSQPSMLGTLLKTIRELELDLSVSEFNILVAFNVTSRTIAQG